MRKLLIPLVAVLAAIAIAAGLFLASGITSPVAYRGDDCQKIVRAIRGTEAEMQNMRKSLDYKVEALEARRAQLDYRRLELKECYKDGETQPPGTTVVNPPPETATAEPSVPPTSQPRQWEFLANRPAEQKSSVIAFGPLQGLKISKSLDDRSVTDGEAIDEFNHRRYIDPMLTAATGAEFGMWSYDEVRAKTSLFAANHVEWDKANAEIDRKVNDAQHNGKVSIVHLNGLYTASWATPGQNANDPTVQTDLDIWRDGQLALQIGDHVFQIHCGFQAYWKQVAQKQNAAPAGTTELPAPSPGMARTVEGKIVTLSSHPQVREEPGAKWTPSNDDHPSKPEKPEDTSPPETTEPTTPVETMTPEKPVETTEPPATREPEKPVTTLAPKDDSVRVDSPAQREPASAPDSSQGETEVYEGSSQPADPEVRPGSASEGQAPGSSSGGGDDDSGGGDSAPVIDQAPDQGSPGGNISEPED